MFRPPAGSPYFMERLAERRLENWFGRKARLPLFLHGQRGVGKTHLLRKFGREKFGKVLYFDIKGDFRSKKIFDAADHAIRIDVLIGISTAL